MVLLIVENKGKNLLDYHAKHNLASEVNEEILQALYQTYEKKLVQLTKMMLYSQRMAQAPVPLDINSL